ncbi:MAG: bifunctional nuclease family protein [Acidimicrobiales bacterium]
MSDAPDTEPPAEPPVLDAQGNVVEEFRVVTAESVTYDLSDSSPFVHLMETQPPYRNLSIPIAIGEATALQLALDGGTGRRPGTHELASELLARLRADVVAVRIVREEGGVYYAELDLMGPGGHVVVDSRPSDAIILAMRQRPPAPILCARGVLDA